MLEGTLRSLLFSHVFERCICPRPRPLPRPFDVTLGWPSLHMDEGVERLWRRLPTSLSSSSSSCRSSPPSTSSCYLPASLEDRQAAARRPAAARRASLLPGRRSTLSPPLGALHGGRPASCLPLDSLIFGERSSPVALQDVWRKWPDLFP